LEAGERVSNDNQRDLFGRQTDGDQKDGGQDTPRRIGKVWVRPEHKKTQAVPESILDGTTPETRAACVEQALDVRRSLNRRIGKPFYEREGIVLYNHDCVDGMGRMMAAQLVVPLTLTSPPYNIGKEYEEPRAIEEYIAWCKSWMEKIFDITSEHGAFWLNLGYAPHPQGKAVPIAYLLWDMSPFYFRQEIVWNYGAGVSTKNSFCPRNEKWLFYSRDPNSYTFNLDAVRDPNVKYPNQKKNGKYRCNPLGKNPSDVWEFPKVTSGSQRKSKERTKHPAQFPLGVVERVVLVSSNAGELVLDPFMGSGSAGVAAVGHGRPFIGFEVREDYCEMAAERFERFFDDRKARHAQLGL
jgi:adenine-specific DNA-methyltransferase